MPGSTQYTCGTPFFWTGTAVLRANGRQYSPRDRKGEEEGEGEGEEAGEGADPWKTRYLFPVVCYTHTLLHASPRNEYVAWIVNFTYLKAGLRE